MQIPKEMLLKEVYGETEKSSQRFEKLAENYEKCFQSSQMEFFSAPGRTEVVGNHTDHNGGKVIAAAPRFPMTARLWKLSAKAMKSA